MPIPRWRVRATSSAIICGAVLAACGGDDGPGEPAGTLLHFSFCPGDAPVWLAVQDGDAAWTRVDPQRAGLYQARFTAARGGVAYVSSAGHSFTVNYGDLAELASISCASGDKILNGNVAGLASAEGSNIHYGSTLVSVTAQAPRFQFRNIPDGQQDLFATRFTWTGGGGQLANRLVIRRAQTLTSGSRIPPIDFASSESFASAFATASVTGADGAAAATLESTWEGRGSTALLMYSPTPGPLVYPAVPQDRLGPGEFSSLQAVTFDQLGVRSSTSYFRAPTDRVVTMGPMLNTPVVTWTGSPSSLRPRTQLASQPQYARTASVAYYQATSKVSVSTTSGYLGGTPPTWDIEVPDLSSVDGWNDAWGLGAGPVNSWRVAAGGGSLRSLGDALRDGDVAMSAYIDGSAGN